MNYNTYIRRNFALILTIVTISGCGKDWMEIKADQTQTVPNQLSDYEALLNNYTTYLSSPSLIELASDYTYTDETNWNNVKNSIRGNAYSWSMNVPYLEVPDWNRSYQGIFYSNVVLEGLGKLEGKEDAAKLNPLRGEALFYRGKLFYDLALTFSPPYDKADYDQPYGVPIRLISDPEAPTIRSTIRETYEQIILDLKNSLSLLPNKSNYTIKPTKVSAIGLLSRVYLAMGQYNEALSYANEYLKIKQELFNYNDHLTINNYIGYNVEVSYLNFLTSGFGITTYFQISKDLYNKYDANDLRKSVFFITGPDLHKFKGSYGNSFNDIFAGVATDEVLLNRSECLARKGNIADALKDLNYLLKSRYLEINGNTTYVDFQSNDQTETLSKIFLEREKQLIYRNVRWSDLRRLNKDSRFAKTINRVISGQHYSLEPNSLKYTFPIPKDVIEISGIQQNKGW